MINNFDLKLELNFDTQNSFDPENYYYKIIESKTVMKVIKGGKVRRKRLLVIVGNKINRIGVGLGKSIHDFIAKQKAQKQALNAMINISITYTKSIFNSILSNFGAARILLLPARHGSGLIVNKNLKPVFEYSGIFNIMSKQYGSSNILNNTIAIIKAYKILNVIIWNSYQNKQRNFQYVI